MKIQASEVFKAKFNQVQDELETLASMDDLLSKQVTNQVT